jgi:hypothetical protein
VSNFMVRVRNLAGRVAAFTVALALLSNCSSKPGTTAQTSLHPSKWNVNAGRFVPSGVVSFDSLSADEICGLVNEKTVSKEFGFDFGGIEPNFELGARGASCGFDATSDGFGGDRLDVSWYVGPPEKPSSTQQVGAEAVLTRSQNFVHGLPVIMNVNGELVDATLNLRDRLIRVETYTDNEQRRKEIGEHVLSLLALVHTQVDELRPRPQPEFDGTVSDVFEFSPAQFCSLLRNTTVAALNESPSSLLVMKPESMDVTLVRSDFLWCSKGGGKLELEISAWINGDFSDAPILGLPSSSSIGLLDAEDEKSEQARLVVAASRPVEGGVEERVITLIAQGTSYGASSRAILRNEMDHIIGELNRRLPTPLIYKLKDPIGTFDHDGNYLPSPIAVPTQRPKVLTRLPLGFGEADIESIPGG